MNTVKLSAETPEAKRCPQCGTPLPAGALAGLCPACLLRQGAVSDTVGHEGHSAFDPPGSAELAPLFPQLEIIELLGKGGMGAVYKARQKQLDRIVALKILPPGIGGDPAFAERFAREARALARLNHPGIVTLYEFGRTTADPQPAPAPLPALYFFLMEYVDGVNLRQLLAHGRVSPREALAIVPQICDALQFAHDQGIVHRDIKPENILVDRRGRVKVADFGLAKIVESGSPPAPPAPPSATGSPPSAAGPALTEAGKTMGTPRYMSPEQIETPGSVDHRADIYALGVVFYQMLTGELPGKPLEPPSKKVKIDVRLDEVVLRALEQKPDLRYQQVSALKTQVETIASDPGMSPVAGPSLQTRMAPDAADSGSAEPGGFAGGTGASHQGLPASHGKPWFAFCVVLTYAGMAFFSVACQLLRGGVPGRWLIAVFVLLVCLTTGLTFLLRGVTNSATLRSVFKASALLALLIALPVIGFAVFFLRALIDQGFKWNPAPDEAIVVPLVWLGALLLPVHARRLWRWADQAAQSGVRSALGATLAIVAVVAVGWMLLRRETVAPQKTGAVSLARPSAGLPRAEAVLPPEASAVLPPKLAPPPPNYADFNVRWVAAPDDTNSPAHVLPYPADRPGSTVLRVLRDIVLSSADIQSASFTRNESDQKDLEVVLTVRAAQRFAGATAKNVGRQLAIVWDNRVLSAPVVRSPIMGRRVTISGRFRDKEAQRLLDLLNHRTPTASRDGSRLDL